jgi:hypothetical protein
MFTKICVKVVWGGTKDVEKNETRNGLGQLMYFVKENSDIQMCVPYRFDLHVNSCVNKEVEVFNRNIRKPMKIQLL